MRVLVTGGDGFLGRHVVPRLKAAGHEVAAPAHRDASLTDPESTFALLARVEPDAVVHLAALCGGIGLNQERPADLLRENAIMGLNVLEACRLASLDGRVGRIVMLGTTCSYPRDCPTPFKEEALWDGYPEATNAPYGIAKRLLLVAAQAYRAQHGLDAVTLVPTNLYGPCFAGDTDVLTPRGPISVRDVRVGQNVYSLNPHTHEIEVARVASLTRATTREWFTFGGAGVDFKVTPDHAMYYRTNGAYRRRPAEWFRARAGRRTSTQVVLAAHRPLADTGPDEIDVAAYADVAHLRRPGAVRDFSANRSRWIPTRYKLCDFAEFVGWYVTEGCTRVGRGKVGSIYQIAIAQSTARHRRRIAQLLARMGLPIMRNHLEFHFNSRLLASYLEVEVGVGAAAKHLPPACFAWGLAARRRLLDAMMRGDGNANGRRYTSKSRRLVDDFCHLAFTCGWKCRVTRFDGCWRVSIRVWRTAPCIKYRDVAVVRAPRSQLAFCFTLDRNHLVYAGRNGKLNWVGQCDHFDPDRSHVIPAMIVKFAAAAAAGAPTVTLWGDGAPTRDFLYVEDCAEAVVRALDARLGSEPINLGSGTEISMRGLAELVADAVDYGGRICWDASKPGGQPRRRLHVARAAALLGWRAETPLAAGLRITAAWHAETGGRP